MAINKLRAARTYLDGLHSGIELRNYLVKGIIALAANDTPYDKIFEAFETLLNAKNKLEKFAAKDGVDAIILAEIANPTYQVQIDFDAIAIKITAALDLIVAAVPGATWNTVTKLNVDYTVTYRDFTPAQTATLRTALQEIIDEITFIDDVEPPTP